MLQTSTVKTKLCRYCKTKQPIDDGIQTPLAWFCSVDHAFKYTSDKQEQARLREKARQVKENRKKRRDDKERIKKRTGKNGYYSNLATALHYYVKHVLRKGEPCYTCGKKRSEDERTKAFHVGHFIPAKEVDPRRFMLEGLRIQCYSCNVANSGMRAEYRLKLIEEMGLEHVEWLEASCNHPELKDRYPTVESIKAETAKYRRLSKVSG